MEKVIEPEIRSAAMTLAEQFIQEGLEEGIEKGIEKGIEEGLESGLRESILEVLELRFGEIPTGLIEVVRAISGAERLRPLHRSAILAASIEEFAASI